VVRGHGQSGCYTSVIQPKLIRSTILSSYAGSINHLDTIETSSLVYLVAFDLDCFNIGYAPGTENPRVGWSSRVPPSMRNLQMPGPDGIGSISPVIPAGLIRPDLGRATVATFTGGFKREHGAFRYGELSLRNHGSHYGFVENGVVFSKLQPGLATILILNNGAVVMKTWRESDSGLLAGIRHARQNGVPLIELDPASRTPMPGRLVRQWGQGNWSGSADEKLRTLPGGLALVESQRRHFLLYAVFSDATPSAMARVFQAYGTRYAMLLDMNALEHTCAVYGRTGSEIAIDHLIKGMSQLDQVTSGHIVPRFLGYPDNRDFFYVMRRDVNEAGR